MPRPSRFQTHGWMEQDLSEIDPQTLALSRAIWDAAARALGRPPKTGGCRAFYTPGQWRARGEEHGRNSRLIIVHDGGDLAPLINLDYESYTLHDRFMDRVREMVPGILIEPCTGWYAAVYTN